VNILPEVSIILVNYNGSKYIEQCIDSLLNQTFRDFEIVFVDNASKDNSVDLFRNIVKKRKIKNVKIILNKTNRGYTGGNNIGVSYSSGKFIVILNNDTYLDKNWLAALVREAKQLSNNKGIILTSKVLYPDKRINSTGFLCDKYITSMPRGWLEEDKGQYDSDLFDFFYQSGASFLMRKKDFLKLGGFDDVLFLYHDDLDLGWRGRLSGFIIKYVPDSVCYHYESIGLKKMHVLKFYYMQRNRIRVLIKNYEIKNILRTLPIVIILETLSAFIHATHNNPYYIMMVLKGFIWNLRKLKDTLKRRKQVQQLRKIADKEIMRYMTKYSIGIARNIR